MDMLVDDQCSWYMQDKILQSMGRGQRAMVTNDGATILKSIYVDNPAAKVLVGAQKFHQSSHIPFAE
jgi:chaperonin GroEL (HSP60 family)